MILVRLDYALFPHYLVPDIFILFGALFFASSISSLVQRILFTLSFVLIGSFNAKWLFFVKFLNQFFIHEVAKIVFCRFCIRLSPFGRNFYDVATMPLPLRSSWMATTLQFVTDACRVLSYFRIFRLSTR